MTDAALPPFDIDKVESEIKSVLDFHKVSLRESYFILADMIMVLANSSADEDKASPLNIVATILTTFAKKIAVESNNSFIVRRENEPYTLIGTDRGWGLDPSLIKENN